MSARLLASVEAFCTKADMPPTMFGIRALGDPRFVSDLRYGRKPRPKTVERVTAYMDGRSPNYRAEQPQRAPKPPAPKAVRRRTDRTRPTQVARQKIARTPKPRPRGEALQAFDLLPRIERACADRKMLPSRFGRRAVNDPRLVGSIRSGRGLRAVTREKVEAYLRKLEWMNALGA